jgi:ketosteroid isomerase-like protein
MPRSVTFQFFFAPGRLVGFFRTITGGAWLVALVALAFTGPLQAQANTDPALDAITVQFAAAVNAKDPAKVASFYAEDAVMMAPNEPMIRGRAQIEARYRSEFDAGITGLILRPMDSVANTTIAFEAGTSTVGLQSNGGTELASGKYIVIYKHVGGAWKIAYDIYTGD